MTTGSKLKTIPYHLTQNDPNVTATAGTASSWSDIWSYQVPVGVKHYLMPDHPISLYLASSTPTELSTSATQVAIEVRDAAGLSKKRVFGPTLYIRAREFQDATKKARLGGLAVEVLERYLIVIMVNGNLAVATAQSYFDLTIAMTRPEII